MYIGIDLGTTNIKAALYDVDLRLIERSSVPVTYRRQGGIVEFGAETYFESIIDLLHGLIGDRQIKQIASTGQAETLICLDGENRPLMNAISWMDERSQEECRQLTERFSRKNIEEVTGQQAILPTWPATKIMWLKNNMPDVFENTSTFVLLKDYIVYRFTGVLAADMSIATFSLYFDIYKKRYWPEMLQETGISVSQLPQLAEPCMVAGNIMPEVAEKLGISAETTVNIGTLDHFAGMIGTGNTAVGGITLSTGTVMALAAIAKEPVSRHGGIALHYGFLPDTHVMLPVAESGGVSLEWFRNSCMPRVAFEKIDEVIRQRPETELIFLPYIVGTNAPEFDAGATGVFWGLRQEHDAYDMARAAMEGVAFVLRKNCDAIRKSGTEITSIIATGGGAKSEAWCQLQADITGLEVFVPNESEAACLGAAMIAAVGDGKFASFEEAAKECVVMRQRYAPMRDYEPKYRRFNWLYEASLKIARER